MRVLNRTARNASQFLWTTNKLNKLFYLAFNILYSKSYNCYRSSNTIFENRPWKVLFFGTDEFAVESLKILHSKYESKALKRLEVVTTRTNNRESAIINYTKQNKITVNEWPLKINKAEFDIGVVVSFGHLIPSSVINAFPLGMINVHGSLLPKWRGAAPIIYTLMNGDSETGVTIMKIMPNRFDVGDIILQKQIYIDEHETMPELYKKLAKLGAELIGETFERLPELLQAAKPQTEANVTYAPKVTSKLSLINWAQMTARTIYNLHRALFGLFPLATSYQNTKLKLFDICPIKSESITKKLKEEAEGVVIYDRESNALIIKCKEETFICVKKITVQGKRCMSALDFYNGFMSGQNKTKIYFS